MVCPVKSGLRAKGQPLGQGASPQGQGGSARRPGAPSRRKPQCPGTASLDPTQPAGTQFSGGSWTPRSAPWARHEAAPGGAILVLVELFGNQNTPLKKRSHTTGFRALAGGRGILNIPEICPIGTIWDKIRSSTDFLRRKMSYQEFVVRSMRVHENRPGPAHEIGRPSARLPAQAHRKSRNMLGLADRTAVQRTEAAFSEPTRTCAGPGRSTVTQRTRGKPMEQHSKPLVIYLRYDLGQIFPASIRGKWFSCMEPGKNNQQQRMTFAQARQFGPSGDRFFTVTDVFILIMSYREFVERSAQLCQNRPRAALGAVTGRARHAMAWD